MQLHLLLEVFGMALDLATWQPVCISCVVLELALGTLREGGWGAKD